MALCAIVNSSTLMADPVLHHSPPPSASPPAPAPAGPAAALGRGTLGPQGLDALGAAGGQVGVGVEVGAVEVLVVVGDSEVLPDGQPAGPDGGVPAENVQSPATLRKENKMQRTINWACNYDMASKDLFSLNTIDIQHLNISNACRIIWRSPKQKCSMMWNISTGLSSDPGSASSSMMRSMSTLAWMKSPSVDRRTVPLMPIRQCSERKKYSMLIKKMYA